MKIKEYILLLRQPALRYLILTQLINQVGYAALLVILGLLIFEQTQSGLHIGIFDLTMVLPLAILSPVAGLIVDRSNPQSLLIGYSGIASI